MDHIFTSILTTVCPSLSLSLSLSRFYLISLIFPSHALFKMLLPHIMTWSPHPIKKFGSSLICWSVSWTYLLVKVLLQLNSGCNSVTGYWLLRLAVPVQWDRIWKLVVSYWLSDLRCWETHWMVRWGAARQFGRSVNTLQLFHQIVQHSHQCPLT